MRALRDNGLPGSLGYPVNVRRVAIANGRLDGAIRSDGALCGTALQMNIVLRSRHTRLFAPLFFRRVPRGTFSASDIDFAPGVNNRCQVFEGQTSLDVGGLTGIPLYRRNKVRTDAHASYDLAPGGHFNAIDEVRGQTDKGDDKALYDAQFANVHPLHSFIPTVSALGFQYTTMASYQDTGSLPDPFSNLLGRDLVCSGEIPFDAYYAPDHYNTQHVSLGDPAMQAFLARELSMITPRPVLTSAGTPALCPTGGQTTLTFAPDCGRQGLTYTFTANSGLTFANGQPTQTVVVGAGQVPSVQVLSPTNGFTGTATVTATATRTGAQASEPLHIPVYVGPAEVGFAAQGDCAGQVSTFRAHGLNTLGDYRWTIDNVARPEFDGQAEISYTLPADGRTQLPVSITASSACPGGGPVSVQAVAVVTTAAGCANQRVAFTAYPNPADEQVTVQAQAAPGHQPAQAFQVQLHDAQGRPVRQQPGAGGRAVLDTHTLAPGLYHLVIRHGRHGVERLNLHIAR